MNTTKLQVESMIETGATLVDIINYLFTLDYTVNDIKNFLIKEFNCNKENLKYELKVHYEIE